MAIYYCFSKPVFAARWLLILLLALGLVPANAFKLQNLSRGTPTSCRLASDARRAWGGRDQQRSQKILMTAPQPSLAPVVPEQSNVLPFRAFAVQRDNILEQAVLFLLSWALSRFLTTVELRREAGALLRFGMSFQDFCSLTKLLIRRSNGSIDTMQASIVTLLDSLVPPAVRSFFKDTYRENAQLICEQSSEWIQRFGLIGWLIGRDVERFEVEVEVKLSAAGSADSEPTPATATTEKWMSGLQVKQCRYLLESGCKSTCLNICKIPTQAFFNDVIGLPLTMTPDFTDASCKFEFGKTPPQRDADPSFATPCYLGCSLTMDKKNKADSTKCS